ncbi:hypothetical protein AJ80_10020 [Polytolypa hystricis UAMH7299]|uniref:Protein kinase domain-containing protein n=1 Tax=Polytolypa hystricis (strain UAMH7299) TaxID=1447883 RepID=A0A2B7WEV3_POLH7|nr:hypothetical protein AJ80_10020 [Polytolypa hystricis UAMH7299]
MPNNIQLADGTNVPIKHIHRFNDFVYQLERNSPHHPYLPQRFIFKVSNLQKNPDQDHEMRIYERLKPLQGKYIPQCYGEASWVDGSGFTHSQGIILEVLEGTTLCSLQTEERKTVVDSACQAVREIALYNVAHLDLKLDNLIYTEQKVKIIDFDVSEISGEKWLARALNLNDMNEHLELGGYHESCDWEWATKLAGNFPPPMPPVSDKFLIESTLRCLRTAEDLVVIDKPTSSHNRLEQEELLPVGRQHPRPLPCTKTALPSSGCFDAPLLDQQV